MEIKEIKRTVVEQLTKDEMKFFFASFLNNDRKEIGFAVISAFSKEQAEEIATKDHPTAAFFGVEPLDGKLITKVGFVCYEEVQA